MQNRISRTPALLTKEQQETFLAMLDSSEQLRCDVETVMGVKLDALNLQQRIRALQAYQNVGYGLAALNGAHRAVRETKAAAEAIRGDIAATDRLVIVESERDEMSRRVTELDSHVRELTRRVERLQAEPAAAVYAEATGR